MIVKKTCTALVVASVLLSFSCSNSDSYKQSYVSVKKEFHTSSNIKLDLVDTISILIPDTVPSQLMFFTAKEENIYATSYNNPNSIYRLSLAKQNIEKLLSLEDTPYYKERIYQYDVQKEFALILMENGDLVKYYFASKETELISADNQECSYADTPLVNLIMNTPVLETTDGFSSYSVYPLGYFDESGRALKEFPAGFVYEHNEGIWYCLPNHLGPVSENTGYKYPFDLTLPYITKQEGKFYLSYPMDHMIYRWSFVKNEIDTFSFEGTNDEELLNPITISQMNNQYEYNLYRREIGFYHNLRYHSDKELWSRMFYGKNDVEQIRGRIKVDPGEVEFIVRDKNFSYLGSYFFQRADGFIGLLSYDDGFFQCLLDEENNTIRIVKYVL